MRSRRGSNWAPTVAPVAIGLLVHALGWRRRPVRAVPVAVEPEPAQAEMRSRPKRRRLGGGTLLLGAAIVLLVAAAGYGVEAYQQSQERRETAIGLTGGDPDRGLTHIARYGCAGCHSIPGVQGPRGRVGPPLDDIARRVYVGGVLTNTPDNLIRWIVDPHAIDPKTAMPVTGISRAEARDVAAYLYSR
jgi:cytochrome c2